MYHTRVFLTRRVLDFLDVRSTTDACARFSREKQNGKECTSYWPIFHFFYFINLIIFYVDLNKLKFV